jgi:DNA-binding protein
MVAAKGQIKNYLGYAFRILNKTDHRKLTIRATGNAIVKALILIELVKRKVGEIYNYDLHQCNKIYSMEIVSQEESKVPGMGSIESKRRVTAMDTVLSKDALDELDPGYQFCKPEPKQEGHAANQKKDNFKKKQTKGPKKYSEEENGGKQRRDENKDKHEQDN